MASADILVICDIVASYVSDNPSLDQLVECEGMEGYLLLAVFFTCFEGKGLLVQWVCRKFSGGVCKEQYMGFSKIVDGGVFSLWGSDTYVF